MTDTMSFIPPGPLNTPVLFLVFNRPDVTAKVFESIRKAQPARLYVAADGPRLNMPGEAEKCQTVREIATSVDWDCDLHTLFRDKNLGCRVAVSTAINWFFEHEEMGIILEDDCLPHPTFFRFCEELLERYRDDERIMMISGFNFQQQSRKDHYSYFFSKYPHIWGWASWRRVWKYYDVEMKLWPELRDSKRYYDFCGSANEASFWRRCFDSVFEATIDTWDAQVTFMFFCQSALCIFPKVNLISNVGFGLEATHMIGHSDLSGIGTGPVEFPLIHPKTIIRDINKDEIRRKKEYSNKSFFYKAINKLSKLKKLYYL